jgi:transposase InsO family protein
MLNPMVRDCIYAKLFFSLKNSCSCYVSFTDRGTEYCDRAESHDYQLYLAINDIEHSKTKVRSPQANGICEHFHKTILQEFYQVTLRKLLYNDLESLQKDLDEWLIYYNSDPYTSR